MNNTAWNAGGSFGLPAAVAAERAPLAAGVHLRPRMSPRYSVVLALRGIAQATEVIRQIIRRNRGELEWLSGNQPHHATRMHLRVRAERIYDIVTAFEAAGFDVLRVVTNGR